MKTTQKTTTESMHPARYVRRMRRAQTVAKRLRLRVVASADGWHFAGSEGAVEFHRARIWSANARLAVMYRAGLIAQEDTVIRRAKAK